AGVHVPDSLMMERGQLVDVMSDMSQYTYNKTAALVGDPDILVSTAEFLVDLGIKILYVVSGTPAGPKFERRIKEIAGEDVKVKTGANADMFYFHQLIKGNKPDLLFGNTYAKYIARDEDIPLIRIGFPIYDRVGHQYMPIMGYKGGLRLLEKILSAVMDRQDRDAPEERYELVM
nr:nitrogenase molybdenum-iron protein subunit beta [Spirochaetota bacterium]